MSIVAEYFEVFSEEGEFSVEVKFKPDVKKYISKRHASSEYILKWQMTRGGWEYSSVFAKYLLQSWRSQT